jgi:spermidine synthase
MSDLTNQLEMLCHVPLCSHPEVKNILVLSSNDEIDKQLEKHSGIENIYRKINSVENRVDVVINDDFEIEIDKILPLLGARGIVVTRIEGYYDDIEELKSKIKALSKEFWISMLYFSQNYISKQNPSFYLFLSKKYHPTANIILQVSDLLDGLEYYSSEIHLSSFVHPKAVEKALTGILKR